MPKTKIDWNVARIEYVSDPLLTYQDIADKYGVSLKAVKKVGSRDLWKQKRKKVSERTDDKLIEKAADKLVEVNARHTNTYKNMQALGLLELNIALDNINSIQEEAKANGGKIDIDNKKILSQQRLKFLFEGLKIAMDGERITLGLPTSVSVNKNDNSGGPDGALFEQVDMDELADAIGKAVTAIGQGSTDGDSA